MLEIWDAAFDEKSKKSIDLLNFRMETRINLTLSNFNRYFELTKIKTDVS